MARLYSNSGNRDYVANPFAELAHQASSISAAAPFYTDAEQILPHAVAGKAIRLLVGLNSSTSPSALRTVLGRPNVSVRYLTDRFHAKIYIFDAAAMVGSANLTRNGMYANREGVVVFDESEESEIVDDARALFAELWEFARVVTPDVLARFERALKSADLKRPDPDELIAEAVGRAAPPNIDVTSRTKTRERLFIDRLHRQVYEQYRPAFAEVVDVLRRNGIARKEIIGLPDHNVANRFLNWVKLTQVGDDDAWRNAPLRTEGERRELVAGLGGQWMAAEEGYIPETYAGDLMLMREVFGSRKAIESAVKSRLTEALLSVYAFYEQLRFVKGGAANLPEEVWSRNANEQKVRQTVSDLLYGDGEFIQRLHDVLYDRDRKLDLFGIFCSLELAGCMIPHECPPINGRMAKALRLIGFDVQA